MILNSIIYNSDNYMIFEKCFEYILKFIREKIFKYFLKVHILQI